MSGKVVAIQTDMTSIQFNLWYHRTLQIASLGIEMQTNIPLRSDYKRVLNNPKVQFFGNNIHPNLIKVDIHQLDLPDFLLHQFAYLTAEYKNQKYLPVEVLEKFLYECLSIIPVTFADEAKLLPFHYKGFGNTSLEVKLKPAIPCDHCGKPFIPKRPWSKYCKAGCKVGAYKERNGIPNPYAKKTEGSVTP